jgi:RNA polymerase sigma-B factor
MLHYRASTPPEGPPDCGQPGSGEDEYQHLEPVLAAYAAMGAHDPRRGGLRERLVTGYLPVARNIASRYAQRGEPLDDLRQAGCVGLLKAIDGFEPGQGFSFLAYAVPTITGEIRRHFRDKTWTVRIPRRLKDLNSAINKVVAELTARLHRVPRPSDIAAELNIPPNGYWRRCTPRTRTGPVRLMKHSPHNAVPLHEGSYPAKMMNVSSGSSAPIRCSAPGRALPVRHRDILIMRFFQDMRPNPNRRTSRRLPDASLPPARGHPRSVTRRLGAPQPSTGSCPLIMWTGIPLVGSHRPQVAP